MRIHLFETILLFFLASNLLSGQSVSTRDASRFNIELLGVLDEYERTCSFAEKSDQRDFLKLFAREDEACIYNDLLGTNRFQTMVTPRDYSSLVKDDGSVLIRSSISDVRKEGEITYSDGKLHRRISFTKYVMIIDGSVYTEGDGGVLFDSSQAFDSSPDFRLLMDFSYDPQSGECRIDGIQAAREKPASPLDESRFSVIVKSTDKYDKDLSSRGEKLTFNEFGQSVAYWNDIDIDNGDIRLKSEERAQGDHYNVLELDFKPIRFRGKVYGNFALGNAFSVESSYAGMESSSSAMNFGVDLGFEKSLSKKFRIGIYSGAGLSLGKVNLAALDVRYSLKYVVPNRNYAFSAKESLSITDILVPVYLESEIDIIPRLVLDIDLGARFYLNRETTLSPYEIKGEIGNVSVSTTYSAFKDPADYTRKEYDIALFGSLELDYAIIRNALYAYLSAGYEHGLNPVYDSGLQTYFQESAAVYPFYYSPIADIDIPMRSLVGSVRYSRKAGWMSAGIKIKF